MRVFQKGFNYSQDGDGNRLVFHLQGCNMKCPWCANPEGMKVEGVLIADAEWLLDSICPYGAIKNHQVARDICKECQGRDCINRHNTKGMYLSYEEMSVTDMVEEVLANQMMFYDGGGVTFTGGEATAQFEELKSVLTELKKAGIHTALETNGTHQRLPELFPMIDQLIMDCKLCNAKKHKDYTGVDAKPVMENIRRAAEVHPCLHVRVPLIGGVNDDQQSIEEFLQFFQEIKGENVTFEVIAYHEFGSKKWEECGWNYEMTKDAYVTDSVLGDFRKAIAAQGCGYKRT